MADKETLRGLLQGAFDTHVHSAPDVLPRRFDDLDLARMAGETGFGGIVLKSHHAITADRATLIRSMYPGIKVYGAIALTALLCYLTLAAATRLEQQLGQTGMRILTRLMGLVLCAIAVQFIIDGIKMAGL